MIVVLVVAGRLKFHSVYHICLKHGPGPSWRVVNIDFRRSLVPNLLRQLRRQFSFRFDERARQKFSFRFPSTDSALVQLKVDDDILLG